MATIYHDKRVAVSAVATTEAAGFPASSALSEALGRPWRATGVGATDWTQQFAAAAPVHSFFLHEVNFATCNVYKSADGAAFTLVGVMTTYPDRHGRRRGRITVNDANVKAMRFSPIGGATTDGLGYWRAGAAYSFQSAAAIPTGLPQNDYEVEMRRPQVAVDLANGLTSQASLGVRASVITVPFARKNSDSLDTLLQQLEKGTLLFDMALSTYPEQQWPVRLFEERVTERFPKPTWSTISVPLREVV